MNVVDNLNSVKVINKPCMSSRNMCLLPRATLHSDSEHYRLSKSRYMIYSHISSYGDEFTVFYNFVVVLASTVRQNLSPTYRHTGKILSQPVTSTAWEAQVTFNR